jgi:hypothetical protein
VSTPLGFVKQDLLFLTEAGAASRTSPPCPSARREGLAEALNGTSVNFNRMVKYLILRDQTKTIV